MHALILSFEIVLPVLYFVTIWLYGRAFFSGRRLSEQLKTPFLITTLIVHAGYIISRTLLLGHFPITSIFEISTLIAFTITLVYAYIELKIKNRTTGYFILNLPFFFQLLSTCFIKDTPAVAAILRSNLLGFHVSTALLGYSALAISAVYGFLYLMLYHNIKSSHFGVIYNRLPNLEALERMSVTAITIGFILLTIAIILGMILLQVVFSMDFLSDPKLLGTFATWLIYALGLSAKKMAGWSGRKIVILSISGFVIAIFSMTVINMVFSGFHDFR